MPVEMKVKHTKSKAFNPLAVCDTPRGSAMFELFKAGAKLNLTRSETPHRWFLLTPDGVAEELTREGLELRRFGELVEASPYTMPKSRFSSKDEEEVPDYEVWAFNEQKFNECLLAWQETQEVKLAYERRDIPFTPNFDKLSELALALLRKLKSEVIYPYQELKQAFGELSTQGLLAMTEEGYFTVVPEMLRTSVPRGQMLKLFVAKP